MIPDHIKEAVKKQVLNDLDAYYKEAEEHEDDEVQIATDPMFRVADFYEYMDSVYDSEEAANHDR